MNPPLLELHRVARRFGRRTVLEGVELGLESGSRGSVVGRSGSGKTSLLRIIAGLDRPDEGEVRLDGQLASTPRRLPLRPWQRGVQMVFQDLALWPTRTVLDNVRDALRAQGFDRGEARRRAEETLVRLGLGDYLKRRPGRLSGGEARRLAFARALAARPRLLLLDEPFSSLDPVARGHGLALLEEVLEATDAAVLLVTHEASVALALGGACHVLAGGRLRDPVPVEMVCAEEATFLEAMS